MDSFKGSVSRIIGRQHIKDIKSIREILISTWKSQVPVLIYQMGKVGSQSVYFSLKKNGNFPIVFFHQINHLKNENRFQYRYLNYLLSKQHPIRIITLVRDPVARNLSAFAHDFLGYFNSKMEDHTLEELEELFWIYDRHMYGIEWFDNEFLPHIGIDIYLYYFKKDLGWSIVSDGNIEILILKLETRDKIKEVAISNFLKLSEFKLEKYNTYSDRNYKGNYKEFIERISLPKEYLDKQYSSKFTQHFYSSREIMIFSSKWGKHLFERT